MSREPQSREPQSQRVLVFDLDDTLYPEADFVRSGFQAVDAVLQARGIRGFHVQAEALFQAGRRGKIFDEALAKLDVRSTPDFITELVMIYRAHQPRLTLFPDARWALGHFAQTSRIALLTDGYAAVQRNKVAGLGLEQTFAACIYTDDFGPTAWKPSQVPFLKLAAMLEMTQSMGSLVYVADNPGKDFIAPNQLGWTTIRIRRPGGEHAAMEPRDPVHAAQFEIASLEELPRVLTAASRNLVALDQQDFVIR